MRVLFGLQAAGLCMTASAQGTDFFFDQILVPGRMGVVAAGAGHRLKRLMDVLFVELLLHIGMALQTGLHRRRGFRKSITGQADRSKNQKQYDGSCNFHCGIIMKPYHEITKSPSVPLFQRGKFN